MKNIVLLDAKTLGKVSNIDKLSYYGNVISYQSTAPAETIARAIDADILITNKVVINKEVMDNCPKLRLICISATGMNNVDLDAARERGISVKNAVGYSSHSVAQHTIACVLQLYNKLNYYDTYVKSGAYANSDIFTHFGPTITEIHNKNVGIIGLGNIGNTVARIFTSFGANVKYYSTSGKNLQNEYPQLPLPELLATADIISIHAPLNEKTQHLISTKQLSLMQPSSILVNVGRGGIVDELALAKAIDNHQIGGACIDVFGQEPIDKDNPLLNVAYPERLVLSPHNAWASIEARMKLMDIVCENIEEFIDAQD